MKLYVYVLIGLGLIVAIGSGVSNVRGIRNNNPGNLRPLPNGKKWLGQVGIDYLGSAAGYVIFDTMANGVRAMARDLKVKVARGLDTIAKIIPVYAPAGDNNNVSAYVASVEKHSGVNRHQVIGVYELPRVVSAMIRHELGAAGFALVKKSDIDNGVASA